MAQNTGFAGLFSHRCCGGPVLVLAIVCSVVGSSFVILSAITPGIVSMLSGIGALGACLIIGRKHCPTN
jgi:hypothetical protein